MDLSREKRLVARLLDEIRKEDGGLATYGEEQVRTVLEMGAVDTLLLSEGLRKKRFTTECPNCGWKQIMTADKKPDAIRCPTCGSITVVDDGKDLVDDFYDKVESTGGKIELISVDSEEGEMLMKAFGGIAAILRYKVATA
jgi:peptide chain release factor subunit 1